MPTVSSRSAANLTDRFAMLQAASSALKTLGATGVEVAQSVLTGTSKGCCQTDSNQSQFAANSVNLTGTELAPLGESGASIQLEVFS